MSDFTSQVCVSISMQFSDEESDGLALSQTLVITQKPGGSGVDASVKSSDADGCTLTWSLSEAVMPVTRPAQYFI